MALPHRNQVREIRSYKRRCEPNSIVVLVEMEEAKKPSCLCHIQYNLARIHVVLTSLIPLLMGLLQVDYQSKSLSPFDEHPIQIWVFFAATCIYCLGLFLKMELQIDQPNYSRYINHVILSSSALSAVALFSIFLPCLLGWFCLGLWIILPIILARDFIKQIYKFLKKRTIEKITFLCNGFNQFRDAHVEESGLV
ncbi:hypothetical protein Dsin_020051 [Dipteronia sinensis]|uniref:Uncharacterized protein n=1 Tax=Dipteronia sinensis TaxID=43782 RepID=A0AAE0E3A9_9ROSI|nr:hypothetical protein Dsin_020051 [Dipteronia sinensis]